jgi:hypothetical protein
VIKTSFKIRNLSIDCFPAIEKSSSPSKSASKRSADVAYSGTRFRKDPGVLFSAGRFPAVRLSDRVFPGGSRPDIASGVRFTGLVVPTHSSKCQLTRS